MSCCHSSRHRGCRRRLHQRSGRCRRSDHSVPRNTRRPGDSSFPLRGTGSFPCRGPGAGAVRHRRHCGRFVSAVDPCKCQSSTDCSGYNHLLKGGILRCERRPLAPNPDQPGRALPAPLRLPQDPSVPHAGPETSRASASSCRTDSHPWCALAVLTLTMCRTHQQARSHPHAKKLSAKKQTSRRVTPFHFCSTSLAASHRGLRSVKRYLAAKVAFLSGVGPMDGSGHSAWLHPRTLLNGFRCGSRQRCSSRSRSRGGVF